MNTPPDTSRRVIPTRSKTWARQTAQWAQAKGATPNSISIASIVFAAIGCALYVLAGKQSDTARAVLIVIAAVMIPLRLLCNMLDGMIAVEGGLQSATGDLFNEVPDRFSDVLLIAGAGYAASQDLRVVTLGWIAACAAVLTAYVRSLGAAQGIRNHFEGPMAKPQRMHVLIGASLLTILEPIFDWPHGLMLTVGLITIAIGSVITVGIRLRLIARDLTAND